MSVQKPITRPSASVMVRSEVSTICPSLRRRVISVDDARLPVALELDFMRELQSGRGEVANVHAQQLVAAVADRRSRPD
jgi:predicted DNA-binding ribbon-helix-helix protein